MRYLRYLLSAMALDTAIGCQSEEPDCYPVLVPPDSYIRSYSLQDVSRDGDRLVFYEGPSEHGPFGLYLQDMGTGDGPRLLEEGHSIMFFEPDQSRLSPDGKELVYVRWSQGDIFLLNLETGLERRLTHTSGNASNPDWSPDGKRIVYFRHRVTRPPAVQTGGVYIIDLASGTETRLLHDGKPVILGRPRWSPDGEWIAGHFRGFDEGIVGVYVARSDGTEVRRVTSTSTDRSYWVLGWIDDGPELLYDDTESESCRANAYDVGSGAMRVIYPNLYAYDKSLPLLVAAERRWIFWVDQAPSDSIGAIYRDDLDRPGHPVVIATHRRPVSN